METKYIVDRVVEDIVVLEEIGTRQIVYFDKKIFDFEVYDNDVIALTDGKYVKDEAEKAKRMEIVRNKFDRLRRPKQ